MLKTAPNSRGDRDSVAMPTGQRHCIEPRNMGLEHVAHIYRLGPATDCTYALASGLHASVVVAE